MSEMKMLAAQMNATKNDMHRTGGFTPSQWVLGRLPRRGAGEQCDEDGFYDMGSIQERANRSTHFARSMKIREACREAFIKTDCSRRVSKAILRKAAPLKGNYKIGDIVAFQKIKRFKVQQPTKTVGTQVPGLLVLKVTTLVGL